MFFLSHQEICISKWGKPVFKGIFLSHRLTEASGGNLSFFFVLTRNISEWGNLSLKKNLFVSSKNSGFFVLSRYISEWGQSITE
jgi:hypothetical protein